MQPVEALPSVPWYGNALAHILIAFIIWAISERVGKLLQTYHSDYQEITSFWQVENSVGFNAVYRILFAPLAIVGISIALYALSWEWAITNIWAVAIWYALIQAGVIIMLARWRLVNHTKFVVFHLISILLTYYLYAVLISQGIDRLLPDETNLRTELWLVVALFFYGIFRSIKENESRFLKRKQDYARKRAAKFRKKYQEALAPYDLEFKDALLAVMIYEDFNRPKLARIAEDVMGSRTRGIMQVTGSTTDNESIKATADLMLPKYHQYEKLRLAGAEPWEQNTALFEIFRAHNPDSYDYANRVQEVFKIIAR